jgi:hypothetical protein
MLNLHSIQRNYGGKASQINNYSIHSLFVIVDFLSYVLTKAL